MQVKPYSASDLAEAFVNAYTPADTIKSKYHFDYFKGYLESPDIDAKTIVIEEKYVSKDYLLDYASYYAFCFEPYPKFCQRVHFFKNKFTEQEFQNILLSKGVRNKKFWDNYLGFVVVKPIPVKVIGYSVLKTYRNGEDTEDRIFWGLRKYKVHLFGNEVEFDSLAFQEQDSVLAACATTAVWIMLNKASADFHTILKSPSQITKDAGNISSDGSRLFPNKQGLDILQICQAIYNSGLVTEVRQPDKEIFDKNGKSIGRYVSNSYLKKNLNAYSSIGIPIILIIEVPNGDSSGLHAIVVSGFKQKKLEHISPSNEISFLSEDIEKLYAHDDQWGPFVRIEFHGDAEIITPWTNIHPKKLPTYITNIIVPLYPKIRISYEDIESIVIGLDAILTSYFEDQIISDLVWDIKIHFSENHKKYIKNSNLNTSGKLARLIKSEPKYLWNAACMIGDYKIIEFTFDATDVETGGMFGEDIISYLPKSIEKELKRHLILNKVNFETIFRHATSSKYYQFIIDNLS